MIESLMLKDSLPLGISVNYIALPEGRSLKIDIDDSDVILILEQRLGIQIGRSHCTIGAVAADEQSAELVNVEVGAPLIWLEDLIEDETGQPRALSQLRLRGDRVAFSATARRFV
jgi:GntR family transcriptional regulator